MRIVGENVFLTGMIEKNECYYILREKEENYYGGYDGSCEYNIMDALWFKTYGDAKKELATYDEPEMFDIIRINVNIRLEEVM